MKETGARNVCHRRSHLLSCVDHVDAESIDRIPADVIAVDPRDQHLALVIVHEQTADHGGGVD